MGSSDEDEMTKCFDDFYGHTWSPQGSPKEDAPPLKRKKLENFPIIKEGFIHEALKDNYNGTIAILEYLNFGHLSPTNQQLVAECVLLKEIKGDIEKKVTAARFTELSKKIEEYFPTESAFTYYIPYYKDAKGQKHSASGKLVDLFYNIRKKATKAGIRKPPEGCKLTSDEDLSVSEDTIKLVDSLKTTCSPWEDYVKKWADTHQYRLSQLQSIASKNGLDEDQVSEFLKEFKGLKEPLGYTLLEMDYRLQYPGTENNLVENWPTLKRNLTEVLNNTLKNRKFSIDDSDAKVLMNLSSLVKPKLLPMKSGESTKWKPTREVIQEAFMLHVNSLPELTSSVQRIREKAAARHELFQPVAVVVGPTLDSVTHSFAVVHHLAYHVDSPVQALDLTFKSYHAIHAEYPKHAESLWLIIQLAVFKIETKRDDTKAVKSIEGLIRKLSC